MKALLIKDGEIVPFSKSDRRMRMSHIGDVLIDHGYEVVWITSDFDHVSKSFRRSPTNKTVTGISIKQLSSFGYRSNGDAKRLLHTVWFAIKLFAYLIVYGRNFRLFVVSFPTLESMYLVYLYCRLFSKDLWIDVRDKWPPETHFLEASSLFYRTYLTINRFVMSSLTAYPKLRIVAISKDILQWYFIHSSGLKNCPSYVCPLGASLQFDPTIGHADRRLLKIVYVGSLGQSYDVVGFARALLKIPGDIYDKIEFNIIGTGTNFNLLQNLSEEALRHGFVSINMHGYRDARFIESICKHAQIGLIPHVEDGLIPNKVGEYLAFGLFLLFTTRGALEQLLTSAIGRRLERDYSNLGTELASYARTNHSDILAAARTVYNTSFYYRNYYGRMLPFESLER